MSLESEARAEAEEQFPLGGDSVVQHCGRNGFKQGALWAVSRITPEQVADVVESASTDWQLRFDQYRSETSSDPGPKADCVAAAITALYRGENGDDDA